MGTKEQKLWEAQELWAKFEKKLEANNLTIGAFAKKKCEDDDRDDEADKLNDRLKKLKIRFQKQGTVRQRVIGDLKELIQFLDEKYETHPLEKDESYAYWFD